MKKIKTIEGFGLPGAGKSTCIAKLKNSPQLSESIKVCLRKEGETMFLEAPDQYSNKKLKSLSELFIICSYLFVRPVFLLAALHALIIFKFNRNFISVFRTLMRALVARSKPMASINEKGYILLDEGIIQYLGALVVNTSVNEELPSDFIKYIMSNYITALLYFDVDHESAINRIKIRNDGKSRFDAMENESAISNLIKMEKVFLQCLVVAKDLKIPVMILKREDSVEDNVRQLVAFLELKIKQ